MADNKEVKDLIKKIDFQSIVIEIQKGETSLGSVSIMKGDLSMLITSANSSVGNVMEDMLIHLLENRKITL